MEKYIMEWVSGKSLLLNKKSGQSITSGKLFYIPVEWATVLINDEAAASTWVDSMSLAVPYMVSTVRIGHSTTLHINIIILETLPHTQYTTHPTLKLCKVVGKHC